jgi:preprotein translocase subunit YajC
MNQIALGDEVMTNSGILGRITRLRDNYIVINIAKDTEMTISRSSVSQVLPKGTLESIH